MQATSLEPTPHTNCIGEEVRKGYNIIFGICHDERFTSPRCKTAKSELKELFHWLLDLDIFWWILSVDRKIGQVNSELDLLRLASSYNVTSLPHLAECDGDPRSKYAPNIQYCRAKCQEWGPSFDYFRRKQQVTIIFVLCWEKLERECESGDGAGADNWTLTPGWPSLDTEQQSGGRHPPAGSCLCLHSCLASLSQNHKIKRYGFLRECFCLSIYV